jgi:glycosyltransferase involved in cell wall biosynthesis
MSELPTVAVVVPAYNAADQIRLLLDSLRAVEYPADRREVIVVDNGSTDATPAIVREYGFTLLEEHAIRSSYAARNVGLRHARADVLAFTDADCRVSPDWLRAGVTALRDSDLVAGRIAFTYAGQEPSGAELFDSLSHMQNDDLVQRHRGAATANLFVRAEIFRAVGPFRSDVRSGGDMLWTTGATARGYRLLYAPDVVVYHPARGLGEVIVKAVRLGTGHYALGRQQGRTVGGLVAEGLRVLLPPSPLKAGRLLDRRGASEFRSRIVALWWTMWLSRAARGIGLLRGALQRTGE